jgi:hypothetical protein
MSNAVTTDELAAMKRDLAYYKNIAERYTERQLKTAGASGPAGDAEVAGLTLDHDEMHFLAARLRRLFEHFGIPVPNSNDDTSIIGNAGAGIGLLLGKANQPVAWVNGEELREKANAVIACGAERREVSGHAYDTPLYAPGVVGRVEGKAE